MKAYHILYHTDEDGTAAAAVTYEYLKRISKRDNEKVRYFFYKIDYTTNIQSLLGNIHDGDEIFLVDYSFSKKENLEFILDLADRGFDVTWIDHHKTSVDILAGEAFKDIDVFDYNNFHICVETDMCGACVAYLYFCNIINGMADEEDLKTIKYLAYVNSYDIWKFDMPNTKQFNYGIRALNHTPRNIFSMILNYDPSLVSELFNCDDKSEKFYDAMESFTNKIINDGKIIEKYCNNENKQVCDQYAFEYFIRDFVENRVYKCIAVNKRGNSSMFGDLINDYDIVTPFIFNGEQYVYSLYTNKDNVDCERLAKILGTYDGLGGGGHLKAAGFQTYDPIIEDNCTVNIAKRLFTFLHKDKYSVFISE